MDMIEAPRTTSRRASWFLFHRGDVQGGKHHASAFIEPDGDTVGLGADGGVLIARHPVATPASRHDDTRHEWAGREKSANFVNHAQPRRCSGRQLVSWQEDTRLAEASKRTGAINSETGGL